MSDFTSFSKAVKDQFDIMSQGELFVTDIDGDAVYAAYLAAFPEGTNPVFRERTEHDCSCCRNFIKNIGNVVAIVNGDLVTVWDVEVQGLSAPYDTVASVLASIVRGATIVSVFRSTEPAYGAATSKELRDDGTVHTWNHFHAAVHNRHYKGKDAAARIGESASIAAVLGRGLSEIKLDDLVTVQDLIASNSLYRGEEHKAAVQSFSHLKMFYDTINNDTDRARFVWANIADPAARFRNTVIGSLLVDLSEGKDLEQAVKSFEQKVAPTNYKRPTALITPRMVQEAMKTINELGLEPALERRFARISDVSINDVLWADNSVAKQMKGGIEGLLMGAVSNVQVIDASKAHDITIADFVANVLPKAVTMEAVLSNSMMGNFMSLTAPKHEDSGKLFKWSNDFGWAYDGNVTDSLKERVKAAGGVVEGDLCCRLAWDYTDDLDFHMVEPDGYRICFSSIRRKSPSGGMLDVDANGIDGMKADPVENIFYADKQKMKTGVYSLQVNNFNRRSNGSGFVVDIEFDGEIHHMEYTGVMNSKQTVKVAQIRYSRANGFEIIKSLPMSASPSKSQTKWGVPTLQPVKVAAFMKSPNHWGDNQTGQLHWMFVLDGCKNPMPIRGIFNENLAPGLEKHRKVFEVLGDRTKCAPSDDQLSGVGFNSTSGHKLVVVVNGDKTRQTYNIIF